MKKEKERGESPFTFFSLSLVSLLNCENKNNMQTISALSQVATREMQFDSNVLFYDEEAFIAL